VNHMADKKLKSLLTMCALSVKKHDREIALYYKRKVKEGKNPMLDEGKPKNNLLQ